jgi:hypothetical protein
MVSQVFTPRLESGDRLSRTEFERRYAQAPHLKAELIEGVVYVASPVRAKQHGRPHAFIIGWLTTYVAATPGVDIEDNAAVRLDLDNEPQPDALLRIEPEAGGDLESPRMTTSKVRRNSWSKLQRVAHRSISMPN